MVSRRLLPLSDLASFSAATSTLYNLLWENLAREDRLDGELEAKECPRSTYWALPGVREGERGNLVPSQYQYARRLALISLSISLSLSPPIPNCIAFE